MSGLERASLAIHIAYTILHIFIFYSASLKDERRIYGFLLHDTESVGRQRSYSSPIYRYWVKDSKHVQLSACLRDRDVNSLSQHVFSCSPVLCHHTSFRHSLMM